MNDPRSGGPVVISGLGVVGAAGAGWPALAEALAGGGAEPRPWPPREPGAPAFGRSVSRPRAALRVEESSLAAWLPAAQARRMSWPSRLAVVAGRLALADAGAPREDDPVAAQTAIALATAFGPASYTERLLHAVLHQGPEQASPALFTESVASAAASQLAIQTRSLGPCLTITQREAGLLQALGEGERLVASGRARRALVGGVEEMTPLLHGILDRFGALARERARPFDRRRDGVMAAEGAVILVVEPEDEALARKARPWARILAWGSAFDPTSDPLGWGRGAEGLARSLRRGLERREIAPGSIDLVVSGASGARDGDRLEAEILRRVFGDPGRGLPAVTAPKGAVGEYGGSFLAAGLLAVRDGVLAPVVDFVGDPALGIGLVAEAPPRRRALLTTQAAGGSAAWVVLERWEAPAG